MFEGFTRETSDFLWELTFHNERPWFQEHKEQYMRVLHEPFHALGEDALEIMRKDYPLSDFTLHVSRIYRDARRLFGRGPYKDHLWFTIFSGDNRHMEGPSFWFELSASTFSYGIGFFDITPAAMAAFRSSIEANPARFERLASQAMRMRGFKIIGQEYKRLKKDMGPIINPWYNRKYVGLEHVKDFDPALLGADLPKTITRAYEKLMPLYDYFEECCRSVQEQNHDELRRIDDGRE